MVQGPLTISWPGNYPLFTGPKISLVCSQEATTELYPEPTKSILHSQYLLIQHLTLSPHPCLDLAICLFLLRFPVSTHVSPPKHLHVPPTSSSAT
jgi:hypothetical protein